MELEILKTYIKTNLANSFIQLFKLTASALIFYVQKPDRNLCLCIDHRVLNNPMIKNQYPLLLIGKLFNQPGQAKKVT